MDEEKDLRKKRRRSIRTLRRRSGVLPLNLLSLEDDSESVDNEGKSVKENQATFGSIWFESQEPVKERRKRRSNIFATLPIQAIHENEEESIRTVSDEPTSDVKLSGNYRSDPEVEKACNEDEDSELSAGIVSDKCVHTTYECTGLDNHSKCTDSSPSSLTCAFKEKLKDNTFDNLKIIENSKILNSVIVECHTPSLIDEEHLDASQGNSSLQSPPEQDVSKTTPSSMSPDFPMSPSGVEYTAMIHNESYVVANGNSATILGGPDQEALDLSLSDKENSINANNSNVDSCISPQAEKEYALDVSPGFFSVCKTFAGKVVNFVKTSPSYLTNALLNTSDNSDISASPALKGSVSTPCGVGTIDSNSAVDVDETIKKLAKVDGVIEPSRSGNENVFPAEDMKLENSHKSYTSSLMGSGRKNRDRKSFFDTFSAISEELMKDTESNKPVQHQNTNKTFEHKVKCEEGKESLQCCDKVKKDDLCELSNELAMPKCVEENITSDITNVHCHSPCVDDNDKKMDNKLCESVSKTDDWEKLKSKQYESSEEFRSGINDVTNIKEKSVGFTSSAQKEIDIHSPEMTEIQSNKYQGTNKSSERKRKRRALDVAYIGHSENETNGGSPGKMEKCTSGDVIGHTSKLALNHTAEGTSIDNELEVVAAVPNSCSKNSDNASPMLSLINVLSSEKQPSESSPDDNSFEHGSCKKKSRRRAFGFSASDESRRKTGDENGCSGNGLTEPDNSPRPVAQDQDEEHYKNTLNIQGAGDNEMSELKVIDENLTADNKIHSKTMIINKTEANDDKKKAKKQKNSRRRSGKFNIVSKYSVINETSETDTVDIGAESECQRIVGSELSELPDCQSSAGLISVDQNKCDIDSNETINIRPAVGIEMPKKRGRRKSADIGTLKNIKESIAEENMNAEVVVTKEAIKKRGRPKISVNATSLKLTGGDMNKMNNMTREGSIENNVSRKPGRPKSAKSASMINMEHVVGSVVNSKPEIDAGNTEPKKRGRRKSADAAVLNIKKCGIEKSENIELDNEIHVPKKRGRRKSADAATLKLQILNEDDNGGASDMKRGKKRKLDSTEDIEMLYRNKNYVKPEEKKPWQTIVESPINPSEVFKKNRLQRYIDFEKPSQLKLRRRFQRATKNGWDPKKHHELNDEFVQMKLARVWSELDEDSQTDDLRSKLQNIVETV